MIASSVVVSSSFRVASAEDLKIAESTNSRPNSGLSAVPTATRMEWNSALTARRGGES